MRYTKKPGDLQQNCLFDTESCGWWHTHFAPEALRQLENGIEGYFRRSILALMPVEQIGRAFDPEEGRRSKELFAMCGLLLMAEFYDWTVDQTAGAWCFNNGVHFALNLTPRGQYVCARTVDQYRALLREDGLAQEVFESITARIVAELEVDIKKQRLDSTHILSHMAQVGRLRLLGVAIKRFLVQLKRHHSAEYEALPEDLKKRYASAESRLFGEAGRRPELRESAIQQAAEDMAELIGRFAENEAISTRTRFGVLARIFGEHCEVTLEDKVAVLEKAEDAGGQSARVLQNPSDPGAGYSGHKGPGYQVQLAQACGHGEDAPGIITACLVQSAAESDAAAPEAILAQQERMGTRAEKLLADTLYGSQANVGQAAAQGTTLIAPAGGKTGASTSPELAARRQTEQSAEWRKEYALRAGIEGLNRALKATTGLGQLRVRGTAAVNMAGYLKVTGWNIRTAVKIQQTRRRKARKAARQGRPGEKRGVMTGSRRLQTKTPHPRRPIRARRREFSRPRPQSAFGQPGFCARVISGDRATSDDDFDGQVQEWWTAAVSNLSESKAAVAFHASQNLAPQYTASLYSEIMLPSVISFKNPGPQDDGKMIAVSQPQITDSTHGHLLINGVSTQTLRGDGQYAATTGRMVITVPISGGFKTASGSLIQGTIPLTIHRYDQTGQRRTGNVLSGNLRVRVLPLRVVPLGLWVLEDGIPGSPNSVGAAYRDATAALNKINRAFWQARVVFVPAFVDAQANPVFRTLSVPGFGNPRGGVVGVRELNFGNIDPVKEVRNAIYAQPDPVPKLHLVVVKHAPRKLNSLGVSPEFKLPDQTGIRDVVFLQTEAFERIDREPNPNFLRGNNMIIEDYYGIGAHEIGHSLGLSTRNPNGQHPFNNHDQGPAPYFYCNLDGTPVPFGLRWFGRQFPHIAVPGLLGIDLRWEQTIPASKGGVHIIGLETFHDKRRMYFPLMFQTEGVDLVGIKVETGPMVGSHQRSLWIRHEDWDQANSGAIQYEIDL